MLKKVARNAYNALGAEVARVHDKILIAMFTGPLALQGGAFGEITEISKSASTFSRANSIALEQLSLR
jgi:hypothetical protein